MQKHNAVNEYDCNCKPLITCFTLNIKKVRRMGIVIVNVNWISFATLLLILIKLLTCFTSNKKTDSNVCQAKN